MKEFHLSVIEHLIAKIVFLVYKALHVLYVMHCLQFLLFRLFQHNKDDCRPTHWFPGLSR